MNDPERSQHPELYNPLPPRFTRVFELEAGALSDPIIGSLVLQAIDGEPYEAVSYVWGDSQKRADVTIDGITLSVTANLHGTLTAFRHRPSPRSSNGLDLVTAPAQKQPVRRLWADALCINQDDMQERISQVELMSGIYAGASRVLSWLGWEAGEEDCRHTQGAIRFIHAFMEDPDAGLSDARILLLHHDYQADPTEDLAHLSQEERHRFEEQARKWAAVKFFFEIEYFHRTWIVQELGLAREAILLTALRPTDDESRALGKDYRVQEVAPGEKDWGLEVDSIDWVLVGHFVEFLDYKGASLVTHIGLMSWVAHHILMVWATKKDGTPACDFLTGMHWSRILRVTDPRDRVFGLLGHPMAVVDGELIIHPDYNCTRGVVYTKLAANFIRKTNNLYVVNLVDHEDDPSLETLNWDPLDDSRMPSWVPDWHSINRTTPLDYPVPAAATEDADISIEGETDGEVGTPRPYLLVRGWLVDEISAVSHRMETTDFPVTHLARERAKKNPFWLDRVWGLVFPTQNQSANSVGGDNDALAVLESLSLALPLGTHEKDDPISKAGLNQTLDDHNRSFAAYVLDYHELLHSAAFEAGGVNANNNNDLPARSLLESLPAAVQAELRRRAEGATSGEFVECMTWPSMCRVVYRTASGLVGMGSRVTRPGDLVCRVQGSPVLMTLRKTEIPGTSEVTGTETENEMAVSISCAFIGPTVVPARMEHGVIDGSDFGEEFASFRIF